MASEWNAGTYYLPGQQAIVASIIYTATSTQPNQNRNPPSNPTWWNVATNFSVVVSATPEEWNAGTFYLPNQEVQWLSILYKATPVQPNRGRQPDNNPSWWLPSQTPGVTQIVAGSNITISPTNGLGAVTINATGGSNLVTSVSGSNAGISVSPTTGDVIIQNTGVTSIAVAGSGLATSGSAGALTLTATPQWVGTATGDLNMSNHNITNVGTVSATSNLVLTAPVININNINIVNNGTGWGSGITHTLYGDVLSGGKYIKWSYDNNPGTQIADNNSIQLDAPVISLGAGVSYPTIQLGTSGSYTANINAYVAGGFNIYGAVGISNGNLYMNSNSINMGNGQITNLGSLYFQSGYLVMDDNPIRLRADANHALAFGNSGTYNVGIDGPFLVGYRGGALGTSDPTFNDKSFAWSYSNLVAYKPLDMCNNNITNITNLNFISGDISTGSNYTDIHGGGLGSYLSLINGSSYYTIDTIGNNIVYSSKVLGLRATSNVYIQSDSSYIELIPNGGAGTIYHSAGYTEFRGNAGFTQSNSQIGGLAHIYGNTLGTGGGLIIDYLYYLGFNSGSNNANLYASGGTLNMTNINGATNINNYNPVGTGDLVLYSDKNNLVLSAGTGNVITNSHDTAYINSYVGDISLQTVTAGKNINFYSTNININGNTYLNSGYLQINSNPIRICSDQYHALAFGNAGTYNVGVNGPYLVGYNNGALGTSGTSFNNKSLEWSYTDVYIYKRLDMCNNDIVNAGNVTIGSSYSLNMSTAPIKNVGAFGRTLASTNVSQPVIQYGVATGSGVSGSVSVTIPTTYTSTSSYVVQVTMRDSPTAQLYATPTSANTFTIGWTSAGAGTQNIMWTTFGS